MGARKVVVFGLARIGCIPAEIGRFGTNGKLCNDHINAVVKLFDDKVKDLVHKLNSIYSDARFTYVNIGGISRPLGDIPLPTAPCCQVTEDWHCIPNASPCTNRATSLFFDGYHPTEASNIVTATRAYTRLLPDDAFPFDISHLSRL
ncbi:hypothetical protein L1887_34397 [Cichorium endivia]|nr:hypothetical protein L1887_34397 [Cichorium endivia]